MAKGSVPPAFLKNIKGKNSVAPGSKIVDPKGKKGTVSKVAKGKVVVKHADGTTDTHPVGSVKKAAASKRKK